MLKLILLLVFMLIVITFIVSVVVGMIMGFGTMFAAIGTALYHIFKKDKIDKSKNKSFKIDQGKDV